jgi:hypothetical protein
MSPMGGVPGLHGSNVGRVPSRGARGGDGSNVGRVPSRGALPPG